MSIVSMAVQMKALTPNANELPDDLEKLKELSGVEDARSLGVWGALNLRGGKGYLERGGWEVYDRALSRGAYVRPLGDVV